MCGCSALAWSGLSLWLLPLSAVLPLALGCAETRCAAGIVASAYFAPALSPCIPGSQMFFGHSSPLGGLLVWAAGTALLAAIFSLCWCRAAGWRPVPITAGLLLHAGLPVGLASPLLSAGVFFPDSGLFGILLTLFLCAVLAARALKPIVLLLAVALALQIHHTPAAPLPTWRAVDTAFGGAAFQTPDPASEFRHLTQISELAKDAPGQVLLFPENSLRDYSDAVTGEWLDLPAIRAAGITVLIGSSMTGARPHHRENVLLARGAVSAQYTQRIPVPLAMWGRDTDLHFFGPPILTIGRHRAAVLLCYEQLLVTPALQSFANNPDVLLAASNLYWAAGTHIDAVQSMCVSAWARLFCVQSSSGESLIVALRNGCRLQPGLQATVGDSRSGLAGPYTWAKR